MVDLCLEDDWEEMWQNANSDLNRLSIKQFGGSSEAVFEHVRPNPKSTTTKADNAAWEFLKVVSNNLELKKVRIDESGLKFVTWQASPSEWIKVNYDGAFSEDKLDTGIGVIARNCDGNVLAGAGKKILLQNYSPSRSKGFRTRCHISNRKWS